MCNVLEQDGWLQQLVSLDVGEGGDNEEDGVSQGSGGGGRGRGRGGLRTRRRRYVDMMRGLGSWGGMVEVRAAEAALSTLSRRPVHFRLWRRSRALGDAEDSCHWTVSDDGGDEEDKEDDDRGHDGWVYSARGASVEMGSPLPDAPPHALVFELYNREHAHWELIVRVPTLPDRQGHHQAHRQHWKGVKAQR